MQELCLGLACLSQCRQLFVDLLRNVAEALYQQLLVAVSVPQRALLLCMPALPRRLQMLQASAKQRMAMRAMLLLPALLPCLCGEAGMAARAVAFPVACRLAVAAVLRKHCQEARVELLCHRQLQR